MRNNVDAIMAAREEDSRRTQLLGQLDDLVGNFRKITSINRNVGFFTTGYNWMIQIIPALIIAPAFIERKIEFGVITQSAVAFATLVAAFSLIVTQFQSLSSYAAVVARLSALVEAVGQSGDLDGNRGRSVNKPFLIASVRNPITRAGVLTPREETPCPLRRSMPIMPRRPTIGTRTPGRNGPSTRSTRIRCSGRFPTG